MVLVGFAVLLVVLVAFFVLDVVLPFLVLMLVGFDLSDVFFVVLVVEVFFVDELDFLVDVGVGVVLCALVDLCIDEEEVGLLMLFVEVIFLLEDDLAADTKEDQN